jgi:O-antigen/teichoic acid export membrane protein
MFHVSKRSWLAATMSAIHFLITAVSLTVGLRTDPLWAPFGALAIGNVASLGFAALATGRIAPGTFPRPSQNEVFALGGWLLFTGFARTSSSYIARVLLNSIVGIAALGHVEAARVVAQPINVLALGLMAQVGPRLTQAGASGHRDDAKRWRRRFFFLLATIALPYALLTAAPWSTNPLASITPRAYEAPGLTAAMLIAVITTCVLRPLRAELLGTRLQRKIAGVSAISSVIEILVVFAGGLVGSFVMPIGVFVGAIAAAVLYNRILNRTYRNLE